MTVIRIIIVFIIGILLVYFALMNTTPISELNVFGKIYKNIPLSIIMLYAFVFGLVVAGFFWLVNEIKLRTELHHRKKENESLLAELSALRNLPLDIENKKE